MKKNIFTVIAIAGILLLTGCPTPTAVTFESAVQTGGTSGTADSTGLTLTFDVDPTNLTADNITVTGATKGKLTGTGTTRSLAISGITVANGETVSVAIANPSGFTVSGSPQTAVVYKDLRVRVTYNAGTGNTSGTVPEDATAYDSGATVTVLDNTGNLVGALVGGDHTGSGIKQRFIGWNTDSGATTAEYGAGATFTITEDTTLYAIYTTGTDVLRKVGAGGGWVFYDAGSVQSWGRYLECAPQSTEWTLKVWGGYGTTETGADGTAIGTGKQNTIDIVTQFGNAEPYASITDYAAKLCSDLVSGGYDDWFLPSKDELNQMYVDLKSESVGGFADWDYWSSSEYSSNNAWYQIFGIGFQYSINKSNNSLRVRAVRAF